MAGRSGDYFINIFNEAKRYLGNLLQEGVPVVDGDWNDQSESKQKSVQRPFQAMGKRFVGDSWQIRGQQALILQSANNFQIYGLSGAIGDPETWARGWVGGLSAVVSEDRIYWNDDGLGGGFVSYSDQALDELFHRSYAVDVPGANLGRLTDTSMSWKTTGTGELTGRTLYPNLKDTSGPGGTPKGYTIVSNTLNTVTVNDPLSDFTTVASAGDYYLVGLTTPGFDRTDEVYLDVHIEEWNATEDSDLLMPLGPGVECMRRLKIVQCVHVIEDTATYGTTPSDYMDSDGNQHFTVPLAQFDRLNGNANIIPSMITDLRDPHFGSGPEVETARGLMNSLEERLNRTYDPGTGLPVTDGVILSDGSLNPNAVAVTIPHSGLSNMPDPAVNPASAVADHDARYGDLTYSSGPGGAEFVVDDESHRDAISRLDEAGVTAVFSRVISWMNAG